MSKGVCSKNLLAECPELEAKLTENEKLKYRLNILKRSAEQTDGLEAKKPTPQKIAKGPAKHFEVEDYGDSIIEKLNNLFSNVIKKSFPSWSQQVNIKETFNPKYGDYQFDACFQISRHLITEKKARASPKDIATEIIINLEKIPLVEKGISIPKISKKNVVVDYSSPNIAKQMHVGHLRSTIIGDSISRLLAFIGFSVLRINHIGDWGTQFGMLIAYLRECFPNYLVEKPKIEDLQTFYKESKLKFDEDAEFKSRAYQCVVKLQNGEQEFIDAWNMICDISRKEFENIYERLDVSNLVERGESFYQSRMLSLIKEFEKEGILKEEDGRKLMFIEGCNIPLTVVKSDGGFTYDTSDLATIKQRLFEENADWILYIVDRGQSEHLETIYAAAQKLNWYNSDEKRVEHVQFGLVLGEDKKKFKTRSGDTVKLLDLLDEGVRRAEEKLRSRETNFESDGQLIKAAESLAYGCIKYADLSQSRIADYVFSFDRMLDDRGNTAVYLLYAYTRIRSIARNAQVDRTAINNYLNKLEDGIIPLEHPREIRLAKQILKFSDCVLNTVASLHITKICDYIYELATLFHDFYKECYVISKINKEDGTEQLTINYNRLVLCEVVADVMQLCFSVLGIRAIDRM
uniref:arginine--tRNA ligase n=1 Tax=Meloidogyne hapla TaxID=6305 RepID=A0A1I8B2K8_MELHA